MTRQQTTKAANTIERKPSEPDKWATPRHLLSQDVVLEAILARYPDLEGVPAATILATGMYGGDCAGGCG